ncbi:MAG: substrate-binding domain-containing protein [Synergistaceae bacterium]|jgi:phosphate transport system substrate-binding protein|nr:substrate-binding domain-containing protein [Synergistaceae bacterium]
MKRSSFFTIAAAALLLAAAGSAPAWAAKSGAVTVVSREDGSGTRGAFIELFGVQDAEKVDRTTDNAEITNNTGVMMTSIAGSENSIGYISLGSLNNTVKALKIDGAEATVDNINSGKYAISRPFLIATKSGVSPDAANFINFLLSSDGQDVIQKNGYIRVKDKGPFKGAKSSGKIVVAGSSSVTPVMEKLKEAYLKINPGANIEIQQSDSSTGINAAISGICDIGMASRELKSSETEKGLTGTVIAMDGIAVIVNNKNPIDNLSKDQIKGVFTGEITDWTQLN